MVKYSITIYKHHNKKEKQGKKKTNSDKRCTRIQQRNTPKEEQIA